MKHVMLVGCGNIGFRHLQAILKLETPIHITVVEPNEEAHERVVQASEDEAATSHSVELTTDMNSSFDVADLAVIATTAETRRATVDALLSRYDVGSLLLEKVLFQTVGDVAEVGDRLKTMGVPAFVNCGRRTFPGYQSIRASLASASTDVEVVGNRFGMTSNAIHFLDLAEYLNSARLTDIDVGGLVDGSVPGSRPGCVEVYGTLRGTLENGSTVTITHSDESPVDIRVRVGTGAAAIEIDEVARTRLDADGGSHAFDSQNVSETTWIYRDLIESASCELTPYEDSARQHRHFLAGLRDHLSLSNLEDVPCPIS